MVLVTELPLATATTQLKQLAGQTAVVTGASKGIGRAIAVRLAQFGASLCLVGRERQTLDSVNNIIGALGASARCYIADLTVDAQMSQLVDTLQAYHSRIDILVHSNGFISFGSLARTSVDELDCQYRANVRAPFYLT